MKSFVKILIGLVIVVVLVVGAAVVILPSVIDPNEYKDKITAEVKAATGRDLEIAGDISLTYFPWLGVQVGEVKLSNAAGFAEPVFARTEKVGIRVKLLPLLSKRVEMDTVTIHGLVLNLEKDKNGKPNWADLAGAGKAEKKPAGGGEAPIEALAVGGLDIKDASLTWTDAQQGQKFSLRDVDIETGSLSPGATVPLSISMQVEGGPPSIAGTVTASGEVSHDPGAQTTSLANFELEVALTGDSFPGGKAEGKITAALAFNGKSGALSVDGLTVNGLGLEVTGNLTADTSGAAPTYKGRIAVAEFDPKALLKTLGQPVPETADEAALTRLSVAADISGGGDRVTMKPITLKLDDSTLEGEAGLASIAKQAVRFDLSLDAIDVDRYLPPSKEGGAAPSPGAAAGGATQLPMDTLRKLDVDGKVKAGKVKVAKLSMTDVAATLKAKDGVIRLSPIAAKLYEGAYAGDISLDARQDQPKLSLNEKLAGIQAGPLLKDLQGEERLTGTGDVAAKLTATGVEPDSIKKSLSGTVNFSFTDGAVIGVNIARMIREAQAKLKGQSLPPSEEVAKTDFAELKGSVALANGHATNKDLSAKSPLLRIDGAGEANLPTEKVDYTVKASLVATTQGQGGQDLGDLAGVTIPVRVTGTFSDPSFGLDMESLAKAVAGSKAGELIEKQKEKLGGAVQEKAAGAVGGDAAKKLLGGDKGGGVLKGLLSN